MLTGHGCFGRYLCEVVGREETPRCHQCGDERDTAEHTISACPHWTRQHAALRAAIGRDISLPAIIQCMLSSEPNWTAITTFAEEVMAAKEEAERVRERKALGTSGRQPRRPRRAATNINGQDVPP
nr:uncharacterized protein LOC116774539 [Danaus plexippus plexippus]XP_032524317.1 uncharacterized protein LOC116775544 [Danaus plexippus plexippus]